MDKSYTFYVEGMHCRSCGHIIEKELGELSYVTAVRADMRTQLVTVTGDFSGIPAEALAQDFTHLLAEFGYRLRVHTGAVEVRKNKWTDFKVALPIAIIFIVVFALLEKYGLLNISHSGNVTYGTAFIFGVVASLSSCMAVIAGLVLSMSSTFKNGESARPQVLFHGGRLLSFFIFGGLIGLLGSALQLNGTITSLMTLVIGLVMFFIGLNLLDVFPSIRHLQPSLPKFLSHHAFSFARVDHAVAPFLVGVATFFMPCGFTQTMQMYALTTGTFGAGALIMLVFALGTFPALLLASLGSVRIGRGPHSSIFFKTAGLVIMSFALLDLLQSLTALGVMPAFLRCALCTAV